MENRLAVLIVVAILLLSGCIDEQEDELPNRGLEIEEFSVTDSELRPGQNAVIRGTFRNYHEWIDVETVEIVNQGDNLDVSKQGCTPEPEDLSGAQQGSIPTMQCTWTVNAPSESELSGGFESRSEPVQLRLGYNASITNMDALQVDFQDVSDIESTESVSSSFSNNEVSVQMNTDSPVASDSGSSMEFEISGEGPGRISEGYWLEYEPSDVFENCDTEREPISGSDAAFVCTIESDSTGVENIFSSIYYKYVKEPTLDITVVNR